MRNEDRIFDGIIREKLEGLTPVMKSGSWEDLSTRIDGDEKLQAFDKKAGDSLESLHVPYQASSWQVLADRLALERGRVQAVLHYKIMEVSLLLLLLVTAWQSLPLTPVEIQAPQPNFPIASLESQSSEIFRSNINITNGVSAAIAPSNVNSKEIERNSIKFNNGTSVDGTVNLTVIISEDGSINNTESRIQNTIPVSQPIATLPKINPVELRIALDPQANFVEFKARKADGLSSPSDDFSQQGATAALGSKELSFLDYGSPDELLEYIRPAEKKTFLRIGFMGSPDYNRVITPSQRIENGIEIALDRYSLGYSGGVSIGVEHGKWEIETGAIYALRKYQTIPTLYVSGNVREGYSTHGLKEFELSTIDIPLKFRYNFFVHDKWRLYGLAGVSLNIVLDANYYSVDESAFNSLSTASSNVGTSSAEKPQALKNKRLTKGWIEGGGFLDNATPYANVGVGIERYMSYRWSVFAQPSYQHALPFFNEGLGPYKDKIHNFGVNMGLKVRL